MNGICLIVCLASFSYNALCAQQAIQYTLSKESMDKAIRRYGLSCDKAKNNKEIIEFSRKIQAFGLQNNCVELPEGSSKILCLYVDPEKLEIEKELAALREEMCCDFPDYVNQISEKICAEDLWQRILNFSNLVLLGPKK